MSLPVNIHTLPIINQWGMLPHLPYTVKPESLQAGLHADLLLPSTVWLALATNSVGAAWPHPHFFKGVPGLTVSVFIRTAGEGTSS